MKRTFIFTTLFLLGLSNASAGPPDPVQENILLHARQGKSGVIVAVSERGNVAADTAWLLAAQVKQNRDFAPLLMVLKPEEQANALKTLGLAETTLPALIYYDRNGREISRVIGVSPSVTVKQVRTETDSVSLN